MPLRASVHLPLFAVLLVAPSLGGCRLLASHTSATKDDGGTDHAWEANLDAIAQDAMATRDGACRWTRFSTPTEIKKANSASTDYTPHLTSDGLTLYFSSYRLGGLGKSDIWLVSRAMVGGPFGPAINLAAINTTETEGDPTTSTNELELILVCGANKICSSTRKTETESFSKPVPQGLLLDGKHHVSGPFLAADGLTLYYGVCTATACELAVATRPSPGASFVFVKTLDEVNVLGKTQSWPTVSADQLELYFERSATSSSKARIFMSTRASVSEPFGPVTLVKELAVGEESGDPDLSMDGRTMTLAVRQGKDWNIFMATRQCLP